MDDDQIILDLTREMLESELLEWDIKTEASSIDAIERIKSGEVDPSAILMDINMPNVDGVEATRRIMELNPNIDVYFYTGFSGYYPPSKAMKDGMVKGYIFKPMDIKFFVTLLNGEDPKEYLMEKVL